MPFKYNSEKQYVELHPLENLKSYLIGSKYSGSSHPRSEL